MQYDSQSRYEDRSLGHEHDGVLVAPGEHGQRPQHIPRVRKSLLRGELWVTVHEEARHAVHEGQPTGRSIRFGHELAKVLRSCLLIAVD